MQSPEKEVGIENEEVRNSILTSTIANTLLGLWCVLMLALAVAAASFVVMGAMLRAWHWMMAGFF